MGKITINDLLEAGCHFGHQTKRWNPRMKNFVYGAKNGISIIDLTKTMRQIADACNFLGRTVAAGGDILFVGTKRQAQQIVRDAAEKAGMYFVTERWMGGALTNNVTIRKSINRMHELDHMVDSGEINALKKKEQSGINRKRDRLHRDLDGIANMKKLPSALVIVDVCHDAIAVREANKLKIPTVAIVDTNGDPSTIDYPVAANDDAVKSIKIIIDLFTDAIAIAAEVYQKRVAEEKLKVGAEEKIAQEEGTAAAAEEKKPVKKIRKPAKKKEAEVAEAAAPAEAVPESPMAAAVAAIPSATEEPDDAIDEEFEKNKKAVKKPVKKPAKKGKDGEESVAE